MSCCHTWNLPQLDVSYLDVMSLSSNFTLWYRRKQVIWQWHQKRNDDDTLVRKSSAGGLVTAVAPVVVQTKGNFNFFKGSTSFDRKPLGQLTLDLVTLALHSIWKVAAVSWLCSFGDLDGSLINECVGQLVRYLKSTAGRWVGST